jgi:hypothetical protein
LITANVHHSEVNPDTERPTAFAHENSSLAVHVLAGATDQRVGVVEGVCFAVVAENVL